MCPVSSQAERLRVCHRHLQRFCDKGPEAGGVQHPSLPYHTTARQAAYLPGQVCIVSRGLVTTMKMAFGERYTASLTIPSTMALFVARRSSRLIPGFRAMPAVITTTSESTVSS